LQAASRYYDLSRVGLQTDIIDSDDLLTMLGKAANCAILAPTSPQRHRILGLVFNDERLSQLNMIPSFQMHSTVLTKMYTNQVIHRDENFIIFEDSLPDHQKAIMGDGLTTVQRAVIEHNMVAVSKLYKSIYYSELSFLLGVEIDHAEKIAAKMIVDGSLLGSLDQVDERLNFDTISSALGGWDDSITVFCKQLGEITDSIRSF